MLVLSMLFFVISTIAPQFGPLAAGYGGTALTLSEGFFLAFLGIGAIAAAALHKPIEGRVLHHA